MYAIVITLQLQATLNALIAQQVIIDCKVETLLASQILGDSLIIVPSVTPVGPIFFLVITLLLLYFGNGSPVVTNIGEAVRQDIVNSLARHIAAERIAVDANNAAYERFMDARAFYYFTVGKYEDLVVSLSSSGHPLNDEVVKTLDYLVHSSEIETVVQALWAIH